MVQAKFLETRGISPADVAAIAQGRIRDPFCIFGPRHRGQDGVVVAFDPHATGIEAVTPEGSVVLIDKGQGVFCGDLGTVQDYHLRGTDGSRAWEYDDPYRFGPVLGELDLHLIGEGTHRQLWHVLGAHPMQHEGAGGAHFAVWAPSAKRVSVVGDFNSWDGRRAPMRPCAGGIWEIFLPGLQPGERYQYEVLPPEGPPLLKADPLARQADTPPGTASRIPGPAPYPWTDQRWGSRRAALNDRKAPISVYEVHLGSWRHRDGRALGYREAAGELVAYVAALGFTHLELMPLAEFPFGGSWGYQPTGMYAPTGRYGSPDDLRALIDAAHAKGIGVIMDWVPAHFPNDPHGLAHFDGGPLYEHADPREGFHPDWNTHIYDMGRPQVRNFLSANALYWLQEFHLDGLRVDAVASMLYRDYSRAPDAWIRNKDGGRENYEAIAFLRQMNAETRADGPSGVTTMAEESTAFPGVTHPEAEGGLGFGYKWNMGWMSDSLRYIQHDPAQRARHHDLITFGLTYAFSEAFVLPLSHDEVVHGKGSMLGKMPGDAAAKRANLRAFYGFMWGHPGKKLLFMGGEFAQAREWNHDRALDWNLLDDPGHAGVQRLVQDLNTLYRTEPALHARDAEPGGFHWLEADARDASLFAWLRLGDEGQRPVAVICNFSAEPRRWILGLPRPGRWLESLNTDAGLYGGGNRGNMGAVHAGGPAHNHQPHSAEVFVPPFSTLFLVPEESP